jgi:formate C-acetyltransferase
MATLPQPLQSNREPDRDSGRLSVLNIQRTCVHDGPGIRTTVFFRGCPMRCRWCQNPEAQAFESPSSRNTGRSVSEIQDTIAKDREYYRNTHGGITLSGGEPLAQNQAGLVSFLDSVKGDGLHVTVETAGDVPWRRFEAAMPYVDLFLFDVKVVGDRVLHQKLTGRDGRRVEDNLRRLVAAGANVRVRMCVVPGHNDMTTNIEATAALLKSIGHPTIELMRYYNLHEDKARRLELAQEPLHITAERSARALEAVADTFTALGIAVHTTASDVARQSPTFTRRVHRIHRDIRDAGYQVCLESAELKTAYHKKHGFTEPLAVQRANLLRHLLKNKKIIVYRNELLVGNFTSKRVGGSVWLEYFGTAMVINLWNIDRQKPTGFKCSLSDKLRFYTRLAPFWATRGLLARAFPSLLEFGQFLMRTVEKRSGFNNNLAGIAHYIVNCERLVRLGTNGIRREAEEKRKDHPDTAFYDGVQIALKALEEFADRYAAHLHLLAREEPNSQRRAELEHLAQVCIRVPRRPARTFHEALQAILFLQIALCTESFENAISLGRLDQVLQPYYEADLEAGRIDYEAAKELVACFIMKIDEVIFLNDGDTAFELGKMFESLSPVETVTVGGVDRKGEDCTNDVTYMILDACELRPIGVNMAARIHKDSPPEYVERIAEVYLNGSPMPALYNDEVYVAALRNEYETSLEDARNYSIVGCVEPVASDDHFANTDSANINVVMPFLQALKGDTRPLWRFGELPYADKRFRRAIRSRLGRPGGGRRALARLRRIRKRVEKRLRNGPYDPPAAMDQLMERFQERLTELVRDVLADQQRIETTLAEHLTTPLASSLYRGCMESGKDAYEGGTTFNSSGIQAVGVTDVADSLAAIDQLVFREERYTLAEVLEAMDDNFQRQRHRQLRADLLAAPKFGDDSASDAHLWVNQVLELYTNALRAAEHKNRDGKYVAGYYGLNVNMVYGRKTPALPSGRLYGTPLANSICPHYGMQMVDLSSALNAVAKVDFARYAPNGTTLTSTIDSGLFPGKSGVRNLAGLIRGYFNQGGMQFQPNLIDREILLDAYNNPGKHKDLVVRIAGYCAYFDDLSDELKREIIDRSYYTN